MAVTSEELKVLKQRLSKASGIVCSGIVQLYISNPSEKVDSTRNPVLRSFGKVPKGKWLFAEVYGALLIVKDKAKQAFFFHIYDLDKFQLRFKHGRQRIDFKDFILSLSQEIYLNLELKSLSPSFLCFEMEDGMCGFNFSDKTVAEQFLRKASSLPVISNPDISMKDVQHKVEFDLDEIPTEWKQMFKGAGIKRKDLKLPEMQEELISILEENGISFREPQMSLEEAQRVLTPKQFQLYKNYLREVEASEREMQDHELQKSYTVYNNDVLQGLKKWAKDNPIHKVRSTPAPVPKPRPLLKKKKPVMPALQVKQRHMQHGRARPKLKEKQGISPREVSPVVSPKGRNNVTSRLPSIQHLEDEVKASISQAIKRRMKERRAILSYQSIRDDSDDESASEWLSQ